MLLPLSLSLLRLGRNVVNKGRRLDVISWKTVTTDRKDWVLTPFMLLAKGMLFFFLLCPLSLSLLAPYH